MSLTAVKGMAYMAFAVLRMHFYRKLDYWKRTLVFVGNKHLLPVSKAIEATLQLFVSCTFLTEEKSSRA